MNILISSHIEAWCNEVNHRPVIIGLNGPQGSGKTTLSENLCKDSDFLGFSLDDFYHDHATQLKITAENPRNPFLEYRGCPGTHDLHLLTNVLDDLRHSRKTLIPKYDKSAFNGRGDQCPKEEWKLVEGNPKVVLVEGWCLGFTSSDEQISNKNLAVINNNMKQYQSIHKYFDAFIHIIAQDINYVYDWRLEQEKTLRARKGDAFGMSDEQVKDFVDRFIPIYSIGVPSIRKGAFPNIGHRHLEIMIDHNRQILSQHLI